MSNRKKVIVFDLDDTIGHFEELGMFIDGLESMYRKHLKQEDIYQLLDLWPKIFRYKMFWSVKKVYYSHLMSATV